MDGCIYHFPNDVKHEMVNQDHDHQKDLLGGKGSALLNMCNMGLPVPPGFTISTYTCNAWRGLISPQEADDFIGDLMESVMTSYAALTDEVGGNLLVSVRSGAPVSMPGMMDTILNVGLTSETLPKWIKLIGERAALDSRRRLIQMMSTTAYELDGGLFEDVLDYMKHREGIEKDSELSIGGLADAVEGYLDLFREKTGFHFPDTIEEQLRRSVVAVFSSWDNPRAVTYRKMNNIPDSMGTAVNIQAMVFGNMGKTSGSGVLFTRNPLTGDNTIMAEYLPCAQGEDVVAGVRTPQTLVLNGKGPTKKWMKDLKEVCETLEGYYRDMVDVEFTVQKGELYVLQSRVGKRSARSAFKIAHDLVDSGVISKETAVSRITPEQYKIAGRPGVDPKFETKPDVKGIPACPGVVTGKPVFRSKDAVESKVPCILVTKETTPDDLEGMANSVGVLTVTGGTTSHAAVVARAMDTPCVVGCSELDLDAPGIRDSERLTLDGSTGSVWFDTEVPLVDTSDSPEMEMFRRWCFDLSDYSELITETPDNPTRRCHLYIPGAWGDMEMLDAILDDLLSLPDPSLITLDLRSPRKLAPADDGYLSECFGVTYVNADDMTKKIVDLLDKREDLMGIHLWLDYPEDDDVIGLSKKNCIVAAEPATVADLTLFKSVIPSEDFVENVVGSRDLWVELMDMMAPKYGKCEIAKEPAPVDYMVFKALKKHGE